MRGFGKGIGYKAKCDVSGFTVHSSRLKRQWNGLYVDERFYDERQPLDFPVKPYDTMTMPNMRPAEQVEDLSFIDPQTALERIRNGG